MVVALKLSSNSYYLSGVTSRTQLDYQKFQISLIWIEENSYYNFTEALQGHRKGNKNYRRHEGPENSNDFPSPFVTP
jgi:hypothetical protein